MDERGGGSENEKETNELAQKTPSHEKMKEKVSDLFNDKIIIFFTLKSIYYGYSISLFPQ